MKKQYPGNHRGFRNAKIAWLARKAPGVSYSEAEYNKVKKRAVRVPELDNEKRRARPSYGGKRKERDDDDMHAGGP